MSQEFSLNRTQVLKLAKIAEQFNQVEWFILEESNSSGIGPTIKIKFNLFGDNDKDIDTAIDITDVGTW